MMRRAVVLAVAVGMCGGAGMPRIAWGQAELLPQEHLQAPAKPGVPGEAQRLRFVFTLRELDEHGKLVNTRQYAAVVGTAGGERGEAEIRTGVRVPLSNSPMSDSGSVDSGKAGQYTYYDVGANFDLRRIQWIGKDRVAFTASVDLSSVERTPAGKMGIVGLPTVLQNKWYSSEEMGVGEQKVLFSSDDLTSKNRLEVSLALERVP